MLQIMKWTAPFFLLLGTAGLLMNEFIFAWGRPATLTFAALNIIGLAQFVIIYSWTKKVGRHDIS